MNENKALKSNIHKDMEREDQLKAEERQVIQQRSYSYEIFAINANKWTRNGDRMQQAKHRYSFFFKI